MALPRRLLLGSLLCLALAGTGVSHACQIPVFRYALERWSAEPFEVTVFHQGNPTPPQQAAVATLKQAEESTVNIKVQLINITGDLTEDQRKLWASQTSATLPWLVVRYPQAPPEIPPVYAGPLNEESVRGLIDSPARREIVRRIAAGESAVWVLIESGDKARDDATATLLQTELAKAQKTLQLPDLEAEKDGPKLLAELPLKIAFSVLRISRTDPTEKILAGMLLNSERDLPPGPAIFPIFGRGRVLGAMTNQLIDPDHIAQGAGFITGPCSCQVKGLNPGFDLLLAADWEAILLSGPATAPAAVVPTTQQADVAIGSISWTSATVLAAVVVLVFGYLAWRARLRPG